MREIDPDLIMPGARFQGADLHEVNLVGVNLMGANLAQANLRGAYLGKANLLKADLRGADLEGANLQNAILTKTNANGQDSIIDSGGKVALAATSTSDINATVVAATAAIGGGASIMGTLSGGGKEMVTIGERCLLGANAGIGISLGDDCVVEAGCYITAGSKLLLPDGAVVKARELSGAHGLVFWRNAQTGALEAHNRTGTWQGLNAALHAN